MSETKNAEPVFKDRKGAVTASVWKNTVKTKDDEYVNYSVTLQKGYKDKEDKWQNTNSLMVNDIPKALACLDVCYRWIVSGADKEASNE